MKKIISLFTVLILVLNSFSLVYAEDDFYSREKRLVAFGVLDGETERSPLAKATKEEYWSAVVNIYVFGGEAQNSDGLINIAESLNLVEDTETSTIKTAVSYYDVIKNEVNLLGYDKYMSNFSDKSYLAQAKSLGLLKNISLTSNGSLTWYNAVILLENFMNASTREYDVNLMEDMAHIYKARGVVQANELTSLYGTRAGKNEIVIGETTVKTDRLPDARSYIGKNVEAYVKQDVSEKDYTLLYIEEKNNNIKVFENADDLSVNDDISKFTYYEGEKEKTYRISPSVKVIFNDVLYTDYTAQELIPKSGIVTAIDNDTDNTYDVIVVDSYEILPVSSIAASEMKVTGKYTYSGACRSVKLKEENDEDFVFIYKDGVDAAFEDIKADNILSVKQNKSGDVNVISVYISDKVLNGKLDSIKSDGKLSFLDSDIKTSYAYDTAVANNDSAASKAEIGKTYNVYIDVMGEIALMKESEKTNNYAWLLKIAKIDGMDETYQIKYMDTLGAWHKSEFNSKLKLNGTRMTDDAVYKAIYDNGNFLPQVITVNLNANDKVSEIETAKENAPDGYEYLAKTQRKSYIFRYSDTFASQIYLESGANVFIIPQTLTQNEDDYDVESATSIFSVDKSYSIEAFNCDEYGFTDLVTTIRTSAVNDKEFSGLFTVLEVGNTLTGDGSVAQSITGNMGSYKNIWIAAETDGVFDNVKQGDIISVRTQNGKAVEYKKYFSLSEPGDQIPDDPNGDNVITAGIVVNINHADNRIKIDCGTTMRSLRFDSRAAYFEYSKRANTVKEITKEDILPDDRIAIFTSGSVIYYVYRITE